MSAKVLALAALVALPLTATAVSAAPASPNTGAALSKIDAGSPLVNVRKGGGHGGHGGHGGGGHWHGGHGGGHWHGGGGHWHGGHGHHHHFRPRWYGVPYFYGPSYYYDDYYDDDDGDAVVYADDAVERCAARYRSFDRRTGTFVTYGGQRKLCPYLR
jgi:hypothetical protein